MHQGPAQDGIVANVLRLIMLAVLACVQSCAPSVKPGLPPGSPFAEETGADLLAYGVAAGDVNSRSAVVWFRTDGPARAWVEWMSEAGKPARSAIIETNKQQDFTAKVTLEDLIPDTSYEYRVQASGPDRRDSPSPIASAAGRFRTAPSDERSKALTFLWSGDLGGQGRCRRQPNGYAIFDHMRRIQPTFAVLLGDTIYGDDRCTSPPNAPDSDFVASTLDEYRAKHRYQRGDRSLRRFLADVPVFVVWDDHEVRNNFSGPLEPLMPTGRQALLEYWPIRTSSEEPNRLYRSVRWGADLELFILDTRQYRSSNAQPDGPQKTMLGVIQLDWLLSGLIRSTATWKVIVTSVPLSNPKDGTSLRPGNDSWAQGKDGTGFVTELQAIVRTILARPVRNVVWLAGDVHYAQANAYDPNEDGTVDFYEFICGPLSAAPGKPVFPNPTFNPTTLYSGSGFFNFGKITIDGAVLHVEIIDDLGTTRFTHSLHAQPLGS